MHPKSGRVGGWTRSSTYTTTETIIVALDSRVALRGRANRTLPFSNRAPMFTRSLQSTSNTKKQTYSLMESTRGGVEQYASLRLIPTLEQAQIRVAILATGECNLF